LLKLEISDLAKAGARKAYAYYRDEEPGSLVVAEQFEVEFMAACRFVAENPGVGSSRFAHLLRGIELRTWSLNRYPFRIFYLIKNGDTLRVLDVGHERRNVTRASVARLKRHH
jgi:toxin ParE1/3/4